MLVLTWLAFSVIVAVLANTRGRDWLRWFGVSLLITPLIAGLLLLALPRIVDPAGTPPPTSR